jgi:hypothetical protein
MVRPALTNNDETDNNGARTSSLESAGGSDEETSPDSTTAKMKSVDVKVRMRDEEAHPGRAKR